VDTGTAQDVAGLVHQALATALLPGYHPGGTFLQVPRGAAQASSYMRGGEHRQVTLDLAPDVAQGDAEHSLVTVERVHLYALGAAAWGKGRPREIGSAVLRSRESPGSGDAS
jgi:hypothetical protein